MNIHVTNKTNRSLKVVFIVKKFKQLLSKHGVNKIVLSDFRRAVHTEEILLCAVELLISGLF